ncbi:MAG TPA: phage portal protein [Hanamia sp.]|nr:phage portal protein [Hanamia sp.]
MEKVNLINKITKASGTVAKSFFGFGDFMNAEALSSNNYRSGGSAFGDNGWLFDNTGGPDVHFSYNGLNDIVKAYEFCPAVYSIVNKQAYAFTNGRTYVMNTSGKSKGKESTSDYATKIKTLLTKPNALQNGKQFEAQAAIYLRLFGYCVILPIKPSGFPNEDATSLWIIPPYMCEFNFAKQTFYNLKRGFISSIKVKYGNEVSNLNPDDVIILRDITPGFETLFLPNSPIKPVQQNISNLIGIYNSKGMLINYRGALGILTPEKDPLGNMPVDPLDKENLQNDFMRYGIKGGQWKFIISNSSLKWQQMGVPYRDLMLTEWGEDDTMVICDALNYPFKLLANTKSSSMNGTETAQFQRILYQDFIIPFAEMVFEQLNEAFNAEKYNCNIEKDFSHITVIQDDKIAAGRALGLMNAGLQIQWLNNIITANQWLIATEMDPIPDGDKYYDDWIKAGKQFGPSSPKTSAAQSTQNNNQNGN